MIVYLEITSFRGVSAGAVHYYGQLITDATDGGWQRRHKKLMHALSEAEAIAKNSREQAAGSPYRVRPGQMVEGYDDIETIRRQALAEYKMHFPEGTLLVEAKYVDSHPAPILDGPEEVKATALCLDAAMKAIYGGKNEPRSREDYMDVLDQWNDLLRPFRQARGALGSTASTGQ